MFWLQNFCLQRKAIGWNSANQNLVLMVVFTALSGYFIAEPLVIEWQVLGFIFGVFF